MVSLDISAVQAFLTVARLRSFTRAAEAIGTTQAAVSMKLQRLEAMLGKRLIERSPREVRLTAEGQSFSERAVELMDAHHRAVDFAPVTRKQLWLGVSDHAVGAELVTIMGRLGTLSSIFSFSVTIGFSRDLLDALDKGKLDAVIVRQESGRRGGEMLAQDQFGWFASPSLVWRDNEPLPLATLAAPCGVRAIAIRALDKAKIKWSETFTGGGLTAVVAATQAGLGVTALARRIAPRDLMDIGAAYRLPKLGPSKVMLYTKASDSGKREAFKLLAAAFRRAAGRT